MQGAAVYDRLDQIRYPALMRRRSYHGGEERRLNSFGFRTDPRSKGVVIENLRDALGDGLLDLPDEETVHELGRYSHLPPKTGSSSQAQRMGASSGHDDLVMALAITWEAAKQAGNPRSWQKTEDDLSEIERWERDAAKEARRWRKRRYVGYNGF